ncbi:MAG: hemolysin III family protein [Deltaproteobacteria bacterium]|nr:hemolysin III family protein [Deltaproteobacteria bacterium]
MPIVRAMGPMPTMRGVLHQWAAIPALLGGGVLVAQARRPRCRLAAGLFAGSLVVQFAVSAAYHRRIWGRRGDVVMRRLDHAAIFVLIAGTYTPVCLLALEPETGKAVLTRVWIGAGRGVAMALAWPGALRPLWAARYVGLGWTIAPHFREAARGLGAAKLALVALGGVLYTAGAFIYAARRPNPVPGVFGFHELFHALTLGAAAAHYAVVARLVREHGGGKAELGPGDQPLSST